MKSAHRLLAVPSVVAAGGSGFTDGFSAMLAKYEPLVEPTNGLMSAYSLNNTNVEAVRGTETSDAVRGAPMLFAQQDTDVFANYGAYTYGEPTASAPGWDAHNMCDLGIMLWLAPASGPYTNWTGLVHKGGNSKGQAVALADEGTHYVLWMQCQGAGFDYLTTNLPATGGWFCLSFQFSDNAASPVANLYVNGTSVASTASSASLGLGTANPTIGKWSQQGVATAAAKPPNYSANNITNEGITNFAGGGKVLISNLIVNGRKSDGDSSAFGNQFHLDYYTAHTGGSI